MPGEEQMPFLSIIRYLLIWSLLGAAAFSLYVILAFQTGLVYTARQEDGTLKERIPLS